MTDSISYEPLEKLVLSLRVDGLLQQSDLLHQMIHETAWTTGSELVGELGMVINRISRENSADLSDGSKKLLLESMQMVKRVWPDFGGQKEWTYRNANSLAGFEPV
jgi:hypothetical protein